MKFKDFLKQDMEVFFNQDEFTEMHTINNRRIPVVIDNDRLQERSQKEFDGIYIGDLLYFVDANVYGPAPKPNSIQNFDGKPYTVVNVRQDMGMYEIILQLNAS